MRSIWHVVFIVFFGRKNWPIIISTLSLRYVVCFQHVRDILLIERYYFAVIFRRSISFTTSFLLLLTKIEYSTNWIFERLIFLLFYKILHFCCHIYIYIEKSILKLDYRAIVKYISSVIAAWNVSLVWLIRIFHVEVLTIVWSPANSFEH